MGRRVALPAPQGAIIERVKKRRLAAGSLLVTLVALATSVQAVAGPGAYQRFSGGLLGPGAKASSAKPGATGLSVDFSLVSDLANQSGALFEQAPFATLFADIYVDRHVAVRPFVAAACAPEKIKALNPALEKVNTCAAASQLGRGMASGYARNVGSAPGQYLANVDLQVRAFRGPGRDSFLFYVYSELSKENLLSAQVTPIKSSGPYGSRIRFVIPRGLIAPAPAVISQLAGFRIRIPASAAGGRGVFRLNRCPSSRRLRLGFRADYNDNLSTDGLVKNADGFAVTSTSPLLSAVSRCR